MKPEIAKKWIEALRSGKYKKTSGTLKRLNKEDEHCSFCALGVLCDIYQKENSYPLIEIAKNSKAKIKTKVSIGGHTDFLPEEVQDWAGMRTNRGVMKDACGFITDVPDKNDRKVSFTEIADLIEKNIEIL